MFIDGLLFAFPSIGVGLPKFMQEKVFEAIVHRKIAVWILDDRLGVFWRIRVR